MKLQDVLTAWMTLLTPSQQKRVLKSVEHIKHPMAYVFALHEELRREIPEEDRVRMQRFVTAMVKGTNADTIGPGNRRF